ncbi:MAG: ComEC/Rec2 family competence protein [Rhodospirillaceae bacterium]|nr:ComEC/Rec2 family competence protein [Rhodospirillaceae bacterium]
MSTGSLDLATPSIPPLLRACRSLAARLARTFVEERERWALWTPVALGLGTAAYFMLRVEPPPWVGPAGLVLCAAAGLALRGRQAAAILAVAGATVAAGFAAAQLRTALVRTPILAREIGPVGILGRGADADPLPRGLRVVVEQPRIPGLAPEATPRKVRIRLNGVNPPITPGEWIAVRATVGPPSEPVAPGAYDFQRHMFFEGIGGVGFSYGPARIVPPPEGVPAEGRLWRAWRLHLNALRLTVALRVRAAIPGDAGAVAAALITGNQEGLSEAAITAMRNSGLAHLLSISGLHFGFVAAILFVGLRSLLALVPALALRHPIKKWAAGFALAGALFYLFLSGQTVPAERSFLMTGIAMAAVLLDRSPLSMRLVAWAAFALLLLRPEALVGPSFQLSFAAVVALIAAYEAARPTLTRLRGAAGWPLRLALRVGGLAATSLVATAATAPYAIYHFNRVAAYGILANLLAVPLTGAGIMPWAVAALVLMPLGAERLALAPMGWGTEALLWIARTVAGWPAAVAAVPAMPVAALGLITFGGLWLCLWQRRWRLLGLVPILAGGALVPLTRQPDVLVSGDARLIAVRDAAGRLAVSQARVGRFSADTWARRAGQDEPGDWLAAEEGAAGPLRCDALGCLYRRAGHVVALENSPGALADDCAVAEVVVSRVPVRVPCPSAARVIDRFDLWRDGAHALWLDPGGVRVQSVHDWRGDRPWTGPPRGEGSGAEDADP